MKKLLLPFLVLAASLPTSAQMKLLPKFVRNMYFDTVTTRHSSFTALPVLTSAPETGLEVGGVGLWLFYSDKNSKDTRVSSLAPYATITTKHQAHLSLKGSYWTPENLWHYTLQANYIDYPFSYFGIGNNTLHANEDYVVEHRLRLHLSAERKLSDYLYAGLIAGAARYTFHDQQQGGIFDQTPPLYEQSGGNQLSFGPSLSFDSRNNNTYTTSGVLIETRFEGMKGIFSTSNYIGGFFNIEGSTYFLLDKNVVLGFDVQEQSLTGGNAPFYLLPTLGSDEMMRGYYNGRYRDRNMLAGQTELRYRFTRRFGVVAFLGTGEVFHDGFSFDQLKPNYGGGVRYFFDLQKSLSIRFDYGFGQKVPGESRQSGFYAALGESF